MNNTVTFKVAGNDVTTFMDQVKRKSDAMTNDMLSNAKRQAEGAKDQIKILEEQIKLLEKKTKLETTGARQHAASQRDFAKEGNKAEFDDKVRQIHEDVASGKTKRFAGANMISDERTKLEENDINAEQQYKDQIKQLREQERQQILMNKLMRENVDTIKTTSGQQLTQMRRSHSEVIDEMNDEDKVSDPKWGLANQLAREQYQKENKEGASTGSQMLGALMNMGNLQSIMGGANALSGTQNGFDLIKPTTKSLGTIIGSILGGALGGLATGGAGAMVGAGVGGQIGGMFGDTIGEFEQRRMVASEEFLSGKNKYEATTQKGINSVSNMAGMGISAAEYLQALRQIAINTGDTAMAAENTKDVLEMEKALGVDKGVSSQVISYFRGTQKDISNLVQGVMTKGKDTVFAGGDYTFLNEFMQKFNQLHGDLRSSTESVATGATYDILSTFNKMGGQFGLKDSRSAGLISNINGSLVNPGTDSLQAMSFLALRQANPGMGIASLMEERQKGLSSPTYLKAMMGYVERLGGDDQMKIMNTAGMFGLQGNVSAARRLYENRGKIGSMSQEEIESMYKGDFTAGAESKTTAMEQSMATIKNGLLGTWIDSVDAMVTVFGEAMNKAFSGATIQMANGKIDFTPGQASARVNALKSGKKEMQEKAVGQALSATGSPVPLIMEIFK